MGCGQQRSKVKMLLFQYSALHKFPVTNGQTCVIDYESQKVQMQVIKLHFVHSFHSWWNSKQFVC